MAAILRWYKTHGRNLPWRRTNDPYRIFVSEIMLQQTQAPRVVGFYRVWLERFPDWQTLATAKTADAIRAWAGLGYNRRALYLREAARMVVAQGVPKTMEAWKKLKGAGAYTAAAVHAFTSHTPAPAVDTNIRRVIGRSVLGKAFPMPKDDAKIRRALERMFRRASDWVALHALMDLGATLCLPTNPDCDRCPLRTHCPVARRIRMPKRRNTMRTKPERTREGKKFPDRIYRGRILSLLRSSSRCAISKLGKQIDSSYDPKRDADWIIRMIRRMEKDGLLSFKKTFITLPNG